MKKLIADSPHTKLIAAASAFTWMIAIATSAGAAQLQEARVTQVVNDVKLLLEQGAPRPAVVSDLVRKGAAVRTGTQSRSELTFADLTITRLGANTIFSFKEGTREMNLINGAILFQVPKGSGGATIRTVGVTAAITGTTGIAEFHPATTSHPQPFSKWLCLEGTFHLYLPNGQSLEMGPGKMVTADGKSFSKVLTFDIAKLVSTSLFFTGFDQSLASMSSIMLAAQNQLTSGLLATNPLDPTRIVNVISQAIVAEETNQTSPPPPQTPTPGKFGTPAVISSPDPYLVTSGTVIKTDPSITTNGVTDYGKIYRGPVDDGAFSLWAFGSTSAVDTALGIDTFFADASRFPIAAFKFQSLSLTGNPSIDLSNDGVTKLALIGVDGITSGPPGGTLTFTGLDLLVLATVNGSINLTPDVSLQDLNELAMYARGAGSNLTINSPISNIGILGLVAEDSLHLTNPGTMSVGKLDAITGGDLTLQIGGSLLLNGRVRLDAIVLPGASVASGINLTLNVAGDCTNSSATQSSRLAITNRDHIGTGGNIGVNIGGNLTAMNDFNLVVQNTNGQIDNGGNITLEVGGSINVAGALDATLDNTGGLIGNDTSITITSSGAVTAQGDATFQILNSDNGNGGSPGQIGGNASIAVATGGDFTANSILAFVNNHNGGAIGSGANLTFNIGGALVTQGDATFVVSNLNEGPGGGTIDSLASLNMNAASISAGGFFQTFVGANGGGSIQGDAINTVNVSGDLTAQQGILVDIQDTGFNQINPINFIAGGHIGGDATVTLAAQNITTPSTATGVPGIDTMALEASIYSDGSGTIGGNAIVNVIASQNISAPGTVFFTVANGNYQGFGGGTIGGDAQVNVTASNLSSGALFDDIYNYGGAGIGGNAIMLLNLSNNFTATGNAEFQILNNNAGHIGDAANILVTTGGDLTANSLLAFINNRNGGSIGSGANLTFNIGGALTTQTNATTGENAGESLELLISNRNDGSGGGRMSGDVALTLNAASASIGGNLLAGVTTNAGGNIAGSALNNAAIAGDLMTQGDAVFDVQNTGFNLTGFLGGGTIGVDAVVNLSANNILTGGVLDVELDNDGGGHIGRDGLINIISHNINAQGDVLFVIFNEAINGSPASTIDANAMIDVTAAGDVRTQGNATFKILNSVFDQPGTGLGAIGGNATISLNAANISTGGPFDAEIDNSNGGSITGSANLTLTLAGGITTQRGTMQSAATFVIRNASTNNIIGGAIGGDAVVNITAGGDINALGNAFFEIGNGSGVGGEIGGDARVNVSAANISIGADLFARIFNFDGNIGENALISFGVSGDVNIAGDATFRISNFAGTNIASNIGGNATINVTAANIVANSLDARVDNRSFGSIGGNAAIDMNVSGSATVTNDATVAIFGNDPAGSAAININGGSYIVTNVGGTFLSQIDGNGTITFNNASAHADVLKAGVFGANGVLNIGGGNLSADTTLKLYAPGSNGQLNFVSNVTLGGNGAKILAANAVTIFNGVVVTIGGPNPADVFTNNANYTGFGGNNSTTGTFDGAGANNPQPLINAPLFNDPPSPATVRTVGNPHHGTIISPRPPSHATTGENISDLRRARNAIHVSSSDELLSLLDDAAPGPGGKITIPASKRANNSRNSSRIDPAGRLNSVNRLNVNRRAMDMRTASASLMRRSPQ